MNIRIRIEFRLFEKSKFWSKIQLWPVKKSINDITHYSKSQIFVQKFNFDKTPTFSRVFHPNFFWQFFSWNQSCQQLKSPKPQHFHEFFTPKNRQFSREIKVEFLDKKWRFRTVWSEGSNSMRILFSTHFVDLFSDGCLSTFGTTWASILPPQINQNR